MARGTTKSRGQYAKVKEPTPLKDPSSKTNWKPNLKRITDGLFSSKDDKKCPNAPPPRWSHFSDPWELDKSQQHPLTAENMKLHERRHPKRSTLRVPGDSHGLWEGRAVDDDIRMLRRRLSILEREARMDVYEPLSEKQVVGDMVNETRHSRKKSIQSIQQTLPKRLSSLARLESVPYEPMYSATNFSTPSRKLKSRQRNDSSASYAVSSLSQSVEDPRDFQQFLTTSQLAGCQEFRRRSLQLAMERHPYKNSDEVSIAISLPSITSTRSRDSMLMDEIRGYLNAPYAESIYSISTMDAGDVGNLKEEEFYMEYETRDLSLGRNRMSFSIDRGWEEGCN